MRSPLRLSSIEQEHLQELYNASGISRDELPYTEQFDHLCREFEDRAFKHAEPERIYLSLLKYTRSSTCKSSEVSSPVDGENLPHLQAMLVRYGAAGKLMPYSTEFEAAVREFRTRTGREWTEREFWLALCSQGRGRRPSAPRPVVLGPDGTPIVPAPKKRGAKPASAKRPTADSAP